MIITRIQIEGGFLDGFDLQPVNGLNVLIGARGTGKTSVIELLRFGLAAKNHTVESEARSLGHARAVLGGGEITVTLTDLVEEISVTRSADEDAPRSTTEFVAPIVLSQTEIESLGLSEAGRLSLLDGFVANRAKLRRDEASAVPSSKFRCRINCSKAARRSLADILTRLTSSRTDSPPSWVFVIRRRCLNSISATASAVFESQSFGCFRAPAGSNTFRRSSRAICVSPTNSSSALNCSRSI